MSTPDQRRIDADRTRPRIMELWWALRPLTSVIRFMQSGAHPDDEMSGMLAALGFRDGFNLSYACSTRGEGGQNDIGTEAGVALGALRTREMERACDVLRMRMYWHSESPDDPITDFGFSKSGTETLGKWGRDRTLARFVDIVRTERPDILVPTFLDVPGQHGHHRAMTEAAHLVMSAAADPAFSSNLAVWQIKKLYLPAWSGAGQAYDDDEAPPPATLTVTSAQGDPVSGWSWARIGQQSRAYHRTQGMGRWTPAGPGRDWPLHLAESHVAGPDTNLASGLPQSVGDLAAVTGAEPIAEILRKAGRAIDACMDAFPAFDAVATQALTAYDLVKRARDACPPDAKGDIAHRLDAKITQLGHVLRLARGVDVAAKTDDAWLHPGGNTGLVVETAGIGSGSVDVDLPPGWTIDGDSLTLRPGAALTNPYRSVYDPAVPDAPALVVDTDGATSRVALHRPPVVLPPLLADVSPGKVVVNRSAGRNTFSVVVSGVQPASASSVLELPGNWSASQGPAGFAVSVPPDTPDGMYALPLTLDGAAAMTARRIDHTHVDPTAHVAPAQVEVRVMSVDLPPVRVGYVGAGNDRVGHWLAALGMDVSDISEAELQNDAALAAYDAIVIGIFAMRFRTGLREVMPRLHKWTEAGGTLVTLYHRPWDNWDPDCVPPRRLEIGQPSLRWRVTDETAEVTHLQPSHPVLSSPNVIGPKDWAGWVKERGLYFAKSWDQAYQPFLSMADPDEAPHTGALLVADIGEGRHVHTSLILHHQMEHLVPGAFRIMANLLAARA